MGSEYKLTDMLRKLSSKLGKIYFDKERIEFSQLTLLLKAKITKTGLMRHFDN